MANNGDGSRSRTMEATRRWPMLHNKGMRRHKSSQTHIITIQFKKYSTM